MPGSEPPAVGFSAYPLSKVVFHVPPLEKFYFTSLNQVESQSFHEIALLLLSSGTFLNAHIVFPLVPFPAFGDFCVYTPSFDCGKNGLWFLSLPSDFTVPSATKQVSNKGLSAFP